MQLEPVQSSIAVLLIDPKNMHRNIPSLIFHTTTKIFTVEDKSCYSVW